MSALSTRIIPARAGSTPGIMSAGSVGKDHPRSRGVYDDVQHEFPGHEGSSPLARGLPNCVLIPRVTRRIIPARAGSTR
mgnify:CR=1 FL=1